MSQNDNAFTPPQKGWPTGLEALAQATLPDFLLRQRWYPAKDAGRPEIAPKAVLPLSMSGLQAAITIWQVTPPHQAPMLLFVPLAVIPAETADEAQVIAAGPSEGEVTLWLVEAFSVDGFVRAWIEMMLCGDKGSGAGSLRGMQTTALAGASVAPGEEFAIRRGSAEQSNTSIRIGERAILKVIRKLEEGVHPELEVLRFLTGEAGFDATPALLGWIELDGVAGPGAITLSVLQAFLPNEGDGWAWVLERLARPEGHAASVEWLRRLGRRTAEMHRAFAKEHA